MPFISVFELDVDTAASQLVAATFARSIQTFPLDSLLPSLRWKNPWTPAPRCKKCCETRGRAFGSWTTRFQRWAPSRLRLVG